MGPPSPAELAKVCEDKLQWTPRWSVGKAAQRTELNHISCLACVRVRVQAVTRAPELAPLAADLAAASG